MYQLQADLKNRDPPASAFQALGLQACTKPSFSLQTWRYWCNDYFRITMTHTRAAWCQLVNCAHLPAPQPSRVGNSATSLSNAKHGPCPTDLTLSRTLPCSTRSPRREKELLREVTTARSWKKKSHQVKSDNALSRVHYCFHSWRVPTLLGLQTV